MTEIAVAGLALGAIAIATSIADGLDYKRTIGGKIYNGTVRRLEYSGQYFDSG
jgi:orotate phosphoribosyltransferase